MRRANSRWWRGLRVTGFCNIAGKDGQRRLLAAMGAIDAPDLKNLRKFVQPLVERLSQD